MKFLKSKFFLVCVIAVALIVLATALMSALGFTGPVRTVLKTVSHPFEWCASRAADAVNGFVAVFTDYDELVAENAELKAQIAALESEDRDAELLRRENEWLKEYLNIASEHPEFKLADASVIARESGNYRTVLTLDRGSVHGVKSGMPVITSDGVFGYVKEAGLDWCKVVSIVETAVSVGAYTDRGGVVGVVEGDSELRGDGMCRMTYIESTADIRVGDRVYTSGGSGSIYPSGLLIGEVVSIEADESRNLVATVKPAVDFGEIDYTSGVMVICGYESEGR